VTGIVLASGRIFGEAAALIFFCFVFLYQDKKMKWVWAKPNTNIQFTT